MPLLVCWSALTIPTANYLHRSHLSAESHVLLSGVIFNSESQISLHKTTSQLGRASLQACPQQTTLEALLVYMN